MKPFKTWKVKSKLALLVGLFTLGVSVFAWVALSTLADLKVNGPYYQKIVAGKDVIADVLPPPEYILESYLVTLQMADPLNRSQLNGPTGLLARAQQLRKDYDTRHNYWKDMALVRDTPMVRHLLEDSFEPAQQFFDVRDRQLIPAVQSGNYTKAQSLTRGALNAFYERHRTAVDRVVESANIYDANV